MAITIKALMESSPHDIAIDNGLKYCGDVNFIPHGGYFYSTSNWKQHGYCSAVEINCEYDGTDESSIELITINKLSEIDFIKALSMHGYSIDDDGHIDAGNGDTMERTIELEIEVTKSYMYENDELFFFKDKNCEPAERDICRFLKDHLIALQSD